MENLLIPFLYQVFIKGKKQNFVSGFVVQNSLKKKTNNDRILGTASEHRDLASVDPERYQSFEWLLNNSIQGVLFETFSVETDAFGEKTIHELKPG